MRPSTGRRATSCQLFAIEALLLLWIGVVRGRLIFRPRRTGAGILGIALFVLAVAFYPVLAPLAGRPWAQAEIFGLAPDPTVIATVGLLLLLEGSIRWALLAVPILWCLFSGATLLAMGSREALILFATAFLSILAAAWPHLSRRKQSGAVDG